MADPEAYTGADLFVDALEDYGVTHVFGNPGTTELPVLRALTDSALKYVLALHEDVAVGAASGYAQARRYHAHHDRSVRPLGVANLHVTPGLAHGLGNLYAAQAAGAPLLVTAGNHSTGFRHEEPILSGDLADLAEAFTKYSAEVLDVDSLPTLLRRAVRTALTPPTGPVFLALPLDVTLAPTDAEPERLGAVPDAGRGDPAQIDRAADLLADADDPVLIVGDGVARSGGVEAAVEFAEAAGLRVHGEILTCEVNFPADHDQWVSHVPPDEAIARGLMATDTLVFAGCSTHTTITRHEEPLVDRATTCIHVGDDARELGKNYPADAAVLGDPARVMGELADAARERLTERERESRLETLERVKRAIADSTTADDAANGDGEEESLASKAELVDAMREVAPDAFVVDEGVTSKYALLTRWPLEAEGFVSNKGGGLGYGLPATLGAAIAESQRAETDPNAARDVVGFVGDGSYLYYPHALYTAARYDLDLVVVVSDNRNYRILKDNTLELFGGEEREYEFPGMDFDPAVDIPTNAESHGARGRLIETPAGIAPALEEALERSGPDVLDVLVHD